MAIDTFGKLFQLEIKAEIVKGGRKLIRSSRENASKSLRQSLQSIRIGVRSIGWIPHKEFIRALP